MRALLLLLATGLGAAPVTADDATCVCLVPADANGTCPATTATGCPAAIPQCAAYYNDNNGLRRSPTLAPGACCQWSSTDDSAVPCADAGTFTCPKITSGTFGSRAGMTCSDTPFFPYPGGPLHLCACATDAEAQAQEDAYIMKAIIGAVVGAVFVGCILGYALWFYCWKKSRSGDCIDPERHCCGCEALGCVMALWFRIFCCPCRVFVCKEGCQKKHVEPTPDADGSKIV